MHFIHVLQIWYARPTKTSRSDNGVLMTDPNQAVIMSNGQLYTAAGTQVIHPPPYNSYISTSNNLSIKQEYANSPNVEDPTRETQPVSQPQSLPQPQQQQQPAQAEGKVSVG